MKNYLLQHIYSLFFLLIAFQGIAQNLTPKEIKYQTQFDALLESNQADSTKFQFLLDSIGNLQATDSDLPIFYIKKGIALAEKNKDSFWSGKMYEKLGRLYFDVNKIDDTEKFYRKAISVFKKGNHLSEAGKIKGNLTIIYAMTDRADQAVNEAYEAIELHESINNEVGVALIYESLAYNFINTRQFDEALMYAEKAVGILEKYKKYDLIPVTLYYQTQSYLGLENYEKAIEVIDKSIQVINERPTLDVRSLSRTYILKSDVQKTLEQYEQSLSSLNQAAEILSDKDESMSTLIITEKGDLLNSLKRYKESNEILFKMINHPKKESNRYIPQVLHIMSTNYAALQQYDSAYHYVLEKEAVTQGERFHESKLKMEELKTQYETEKKEATIALQEQQLSQQRMIQWLAIGFAGVLGLLFFQSYRNAQTRKRNNEALEKTNQLLEVKNQENEVLLKEIHHRVKNNLQTISSLLNLQSNSISDPNALDAVQESRNRVASMAMIHQKLYQGENLAAIEMRDYFETIGNAIISSFGEKAKGVELDIEMPEIELDVDTAIPIGLITNELLTNSLKYAFTENGAGKISISMKKTANNKIQLLIADDGRHDISAATSKGGTGFGGMLVQLLTQQLGGQMNQSTEKGTATQIEFSLENKMAA